MLLFKDMKQNYPVFILDKNDMQYCQGKVNSISFPHADLSKTGYGAPMVVDVVIEANGKVASYTIPESSSVAYSGNNLILSTERNCIVRELEAIKADDEQVINSMDTRKSRLEKVETLLTDLDVSYKEKATYEKRFSNIESSITSLTDAVNGFIKELKN